MKNKPIEWLKTIRISRNLSTYKVSKLAHISQSHYSMIENGKRGVSIKAAKKIAGALGFEWTKFYDTTIENDHPA